MQNESHFGGTQSARRRHRGHGDFFYRNRIPAPRGEADRKLAARIPAITEPRAPASGRPIRAMSRRR